MGGIFLLLCHFLFNHTDLDLIFRVFKIFGEAEALSSVNIPKCALFCQLPTSCRRTACLNIHSLVPSFVLTAIDITGK